MRTILVGKVNPKHAEMYQVVQEALFGCKDKIRCGNTMGDVFKEYATICDKHGMKEHRLNATGYSLGAVFAPTWMDYPMFYEGSPYIIQENMTLFLHIILMNTRDNLAMCLGETYVVREEGPERLSNLEIKMDCK